MDNAEHSAERIGDFILSEFLSYVAENDISSDEIPDVDRVKFVEWVWEKYGDGSEYDLRAQYPDLEDVTVTALWSFFFERTPIQLSDCVFTLWPRLALAGRKPAKYKPVSLETTMTMTFPDERYVGIYKIEINEQHGKGFSIEGDLATIVTRYLIEPAVIDAFGQGFDDIYETTTSPQDN